MIPRRALFFVLLVAITGAHSIRACDCMTMKFNPSRAVKKADAVFVGKVVAIKDATVPPGVSSYSPGRQVTFEATEAWKGVAAARTVVRTGFGGGDCGYPFVAGERYLVFASYARGDSEGRALVTGICSDTTALSKSTVKLTKLRRWRASRRIGS